MFFTALFVHIIAAVLSEEPPAPPQNLHVDGWLMTWSPASEERNVTYSVQYSIFDSGVWINVPACIQTPANRCDVASTKAEDKQACVMLRVQAEGRGLKSLPVEACSRHGDLCTPEFSLTARPSHLTVHLSRNHSLAQEHEDHAQHRVYFGMEGEPLKRFKDSVSSVSFDGLQVGRRYCVKVQYTYFSLPVGMPSCARCELIPESDKQLGEAWIVPTVVSVVVLMALTAGILYVLVFHCGRIKQWLQESRYQISEEIFLEPFLERHHPVIIDSPSEELCDVITSITPLEPPAGHDGAL